MDEPLRADLLRADLLRPEPLRVERTVDLDLPADELWRLISTANGWREWMADEATIAITAGAEGTVVDDGVERVVRIHEVLDGRAVTFHWSEPGTIDDLAVVTKSVTSVVTLALEERPGGGHRLHITEEWLGATACADCPLRAGDRWDLRTCVLCLTAGTPCRV